MADRIVMKDLNWDWVISSGTLVECHCVDCDFECECGLKKPMRYRIPHDNREPTWMCGYYFVILGD